MNSKLNLNMIVVAVFFIASACSPTANSIPILDQAQPESAYNLAPSVPVTGELPAYTADRQTYDFEQEVWAYPSQQLHSACVSEDIQRLGKCEEAELKASTFHHVNENTAAPAYPGQKLHSHCVSVDIQRQDDCVE
jgi:hypothetical protein